MSFVLLTQMMEGGKIILIQFHTPLPTIKGGGAGKHLDFLPV